MGGRYEKTVEFSVAVKGGKLEFAPFETPPPVKEGTWARLILPIEKVSDKRLRKDLGQETMVRLLPKGTLLLALADIRMEREQNLSAPADIHTQREWAALVQHVVDGRFVPFILADALHLRLRQTKIAHLCSCRCEIQALHRTAISVNHAYTLISAAFEGAIGGRSISGR
jgi:hypothetical protein